MDCKRKSQQNLILIELNLMIFLNELLDSDMSRNIRHVDTEVVNFILFTVLNSCIFKNRLDQNKSILPTNRKV